MKVSESTIYSIEKEDWKKAKGVKFTGIETNSALIMRDYSIECELSKCICVIKGYFIWWCTNHHQPYFQCERGREEKILNTK